LLAGVGARIALAARRVDKLHALVESITSAGGEARAISLDVTDYASVVRCFDELANWGAPDVVVNNAGITTTPCAVGADRRRFRQRDCDQSQGELAGDHRGCPANGGCGSRRQYRKYCLYPG
jgi:NADP-dependent 3-hydroxy acid dehydrogenase YdfG